MRFTNTLQKSHHTSSVVFQMFYSCIRLLIGFFLQQLVYIFNKKTRDRKRLLGSILLEISEFHVVST